MRVSPVIGRVGGKTYAEFQARIAVLATNGLVGWSNSSFMAPGAFRTTVGAFGGGMVGSTWASVVDNSSSIIRGVQHGLPSPAEVANQAGRELFFRIAAGPNTVEFSGLNRNGFASSSYFDGGTYLSFQMTELIYWDGTKPMRIVPSTGSSPAEYAW